MVCTLSVDRNPISIGVCRIIEDNRVKIVIIFEIFCEFLFSNPIKVKFAIAPKKSTIKATRG